MTAQRHRVLVVDDDADFAAGVAAILERAGFAVRSVRTGADVLREVTRWPTDVILLDHRMPGLTGLQVVLALRARGFTQPVILASGAENAPMLADVLGLRHWLGKPFEAEELLHALRVTLSERRA
jgi:DNA-binding response OmpR family regulator